MKTKKNSRSPAPKLATKRSSTKFPGLNPKVNTRKRQHLIDQDYAKDLSPKDKAWLNKFNEETISASFKKKDGKYSGNLHKKRSLKARTFHREQRT